MAKNIMADVARLLGVELEEEFKIQGSDELYKLTNTNLFHVKDGETWSSNILLVAMLTGDCEIVKLPWRPKDNDKFYCISFINDGNTGIGIDTFVWRGTNLDYAMLNAGVIYRTCEECEAHLHEDYKKLTGREWSEEE